MLEATRKKHYTRLYIALGYGYARRLISKLSNKFCDYTNKDKISRHFVISLNTLHTARQKVHSINNQVKGYFEFIPCHAGSQSEILVRRSYGWLPERNLYYEVK